MAERQVVEAWSAISEISPVVQKKQVSAIFLLFPVLLAAVFGGYLYFDFRSDFSNPCANLVPQSNNITFFANSTVSGTVVNATNSGQNFYQAGACPQPVHQNLYHAISVISQDPRFVKAENGSQFTIDPINSLNGNESLLNGTMVQELIFNHLNLSDPIYPCNLNLIYSNPISAIYVFVPVLPNGTEVFSNDSIAVYPGNQLRFYCPAETGVTTFVRSQIPGHFDVGNFSFNLVSNQTNFVGVNGTSYPGYDYAFNVTYQNFTAQTQQAVFSWPSATALSSGQLPSPFIATPYSLPSAIFVVMRWFANSTGTYLTITTLA